MLRLIVVSILRLLLTPLSVWLAAVISPGTEVGFGWNLLLFPLILGIVNAIAWHVLGPLGWTRRQLTFGIGILMVNAVAFWLAGQLYSQVNISWVTPLLGSLVVSAVNAALTWLLVRRAPAASS